jgi:site-specific recombinase XerD
MAGTPRRIGQSCGVSVRDMRRSWELSLRAGKASPHTVISRMGALDGFTRYLEEQGNAIELEAITQAHVQGYIIELLATRATWTAITRYRGLRAFFRWCVDEGELRESPMRGMREPPQTEKDPEMPTAEELRRVLRMCKRDASFYGKRDFALFYLFADTGLRLTECANILLDHVDWEQATIRIHGKGDVWRMVHIAGAAQHALDRYVRVRARHRDVADTHLWLGYRGHLTRSGVYCMVKARAQAAGVGWLHPHLLRHYFAHAFLDAGGPEQDLRMLGGWKSDVMYRYGRKLRSERAMRSHSEFSPGDRL